MSQLPVITVSRQYGSGGRYIAKMLASQLNIPYYDNELITLAAEQSGFDPKLFECADRNASNSLLFSLSLYSGVTGTYNMPLGDRIFLIQSDIIRKVSDQGPCVIVGRCANYVLREHPNCVSVFLHAPIQKRVDRAVAFYSLEPGRAKEEIARIDKKRSVYYANFSGEKWGDAANYDLSINTDRVGTDGAVEILRCMAEQLSK
ncbi:MAG: cytidylate kinase-like family protein [Oscillospiraceae bacterium]